jgi:hypothetical protein
VVAHESGLSHPILALERWARRIVSEDSIHSVASLSAAIHPFPESKNRGVVLVTQTTGRQKRYCAPPQPVVLCFLAHDRKPIEERHDTRGEIGKSIDIPIPTIVSCRRSPPQPNVSMKSSRGTRSCCDTLKAAEILKPR